MEKFNQKNYPNTYKYVTDNITPKIRCNRCNSIVLKSKSKDYKFQCMFCDEDLYTIETHEGEKYDENELNDILLVTRDLLLLDTPAKEEENVITFLNKMKALNPNWQTDCSHCVVANGECHELAKEGRCRAWKNAKNKE